MGRDLLDVVISCRLCCFIGVVNDTEPASRVWTCMHERLRVSSAIDTESGLYCHRTSLKVIVTRTAMEFTQDIGDNDDYHWSTTLVPLHDRPGREPVAQHVTGSTQQGKTTT